MQLIIYTDGASRGNPGHASFGFTIADKSGKILYEDSRYIGIATNNVAEYRAVLEALREVKKKFSKGLESIELFADSKLAAEQLSGRYKIKSPHLKPIIEKIKMLDLELGGVVYFHIPRSQNIRADDLANQALDNK